MMEEMDIIRKAKKRLCQLLLLLTKKNDQTKTAVRGYNVV